MIGVGRPCNLITSLKNNLVICEATVLREQGKKYAILENLSTITKTRSCLHAVWAILGPSPR